jgi:NAD-dependent deacetylase
MNSSSKFSADLIESLRAARRIVVLTGAGVSAESGVPTFRDAQTGLWAKYRPEDLATPEAFRRNPKLVWEWYQSRRARLAEVEPNPGHLALAELEQRTPEFLLVTQNVDGLHQRAGNRRLVELHGNITRTKCFEENVCVDQWSDDGQVPPRCPRCGGLLRPDVVWFNEMLPERAWAEAEAASRACEVFFSIGTSALVHPAASLPLESVEHDAVLVEINPEATPLTARAHHFLQGRSGEVLPSLLRVVWP